MEKNTGKKFEVFRHNSAQAAAAEGGEILSGLLAENQKHPVLLMLSGGSALLMLDYVGPSSLRENLTVSMLDERFSQDEAINNFSRLQKLEFYKDALNAGCSFFGTLPRSGETMPDLAARWEKNLRAWKQENPSGLIVATLGMGSDGHTAGIFPFEDKNKFDGLFNLERWVTDYDASGKHQYNLRITTTLTFLKLIDIGIGYVCGKDKKNKLDELVANQSSVNKFPAAAWREIKQIKIFTDIEM